MGGDGDGKEDLKRGVGWEGCVGAKGWSKEKNENRIVERMRRKLAECKVQKRRLMIMGGGRKVKCHTL